MHPVSELQKLANVLVFRTRRLQALARQIEQQETQDCAAQLTYLTIESLTTWTNFCRSFYLSCAVRNARRIGGARISHSRLAIVDDQSAMMEAIKELKPNSLKYVQGGQKIDGRLEPTWHQKQALVKLSGQMQFSNNTDIVTAFSYPATFMDELPMVRNFFAHRSHDTAQKVERLARRQYGIAFLKHPGELVNKTLTGKTEPLLIEWLIDMRAIGTALCI